MNKLKGTFTRIQFLIKLTFKEIKAFDPVDGQSAQITTLNLSLNYFVHFCKFFRLCLAPAFSSLATERLAFRIDRSFLHSSFILQTTHCTVDSFQPLPPLFLSSLYGNYDSLSKIGAS